jgi:hypothetical protein
MQQQQQQPEKSRAIATVCRLRLYVILFIFKKLFFCLAVDVKEGKEPWRHL